MFKNTLLALIFAFFSGSQISSLAQDSQQQSHLWAAVVKGDARAVKTLIAAGAKVSDEYRGASRLSMAAQLDHAEVVKILLDAGVNVHGRDDFGNTALISAAERGNTEIVGILLAAGAQVNECGTFGMTALMYAAQMNRRETVEFLLAAGASVNQRDYRGRTALTHAKQMGFNRIVKILTDAGANDTD